MSDAEQDRVHQILDELVRFGLISSNIGLIRDDGDDSNKLVGNNIKYQSNVNKMDDGAIVFFLGHEYGHKTLRNFFTSFESDHNILWQFFHSLFALIFTLFMISVSLGRLYFIEDVHYQTMVYLISLLVVVCLIRKLILDDEYRSDSIGALVLLFFGEMKGIKVSPYKSFKEFLKPRNATEKNNKFSIISCFLKIVDLFLHPSNDKRIKALLKFEEFHLSKNQK